MSKILNVSENRISNSNEYAAVDIMKIILSFMVVHIHCHIFMGEINPINSVLNVSIGQLAVPIFFSCSGFFFYKKISVDSSFKTMLNYEKRIFLLYFFWTLLYIPCIFVTDFSGSYDSITISSFVGQVLYNIKKFFFSCSFTQFWYLSVMVYTIPLLYFMYKKLKPPTVFIISFILSVFFIILTNHFNSLEFIPPVILRILVRGAPYFSAGALLCYLKERHISVNRIICIISVVLYLAIDISLVLILTENSNVYLTIHEIIFIIESFSILSLIMSIKIPSKPIHKDFRNMSTLIYCSHLIVPNNAFEYVFYKLNFDPREFKGIIEFTIVIIYTVVISYTILKLSKKEKFKFLRYLY